MNKQLPESQYIEKKPKTLKILGDCDERSFDSSSNVVQRSLKRIGSEKEIRAISIEKVRVLENNINRGALNNNIQVLNPSNKMIPAYNVKLIILR